MKANMQSVKEGRRKGKTKGKSKYAAKLASGRMMYGPGCCAHTRQVRRYQGEESPDV